MAEVKKAETKKGNGVCFVAMPFGADAAEAKRYMAWFKNVYEPAIAAVGDCKAHHFLSDHAPVSINKDIFDHLLNDELAIFDLAGLTPDAPPNPNVMYELGVRHAFRLPSVIFGWEGQKLPFDVGSQRAVLGVRDMEGIASCRESMIAALKSAKAGRFYNPLEGVARAERIDAASMGDPDFKLLADRIAEFGDQLVEFRRTHAPETVESELEREIDRRFLNSSASMWNEFVVQLEKLSFTNDEIEFMMPKLLKRWRVDRHDGVGIKEWLRDFGPLQVRERIQEREKLP